MTPNPTMASRWSHRVERQSRGGHSHASRMSSLSASMSSISLSTAARPRTPAKHAPNARGRAFVLLNSPKRVTQTGGRVYRTHDIRTITRRLRTMRQPRTELFHPRSVPQDPETGLPLCNVASVAPPTMLIGEEQERELQDLADVIEGRRVLDTPEIGMSNPLPLREPSHITAEQRRGMVTSMPGLQVDTDMDMVTTSPIASPVTTGLPFDYPGCAAPSRAGQTSPVDSGIGSPMRSRRPMRRLNEETGEAVEMMEELSLTSSAETVRPASSA